ncbi:MAG TPA: hypothetical protein VGP72_08170 [Planctomycetota bacterium]|jgi:hypothetical protein
MFGWLFGEKRKKPKWTVHLEGAAQTNVETAAAWTVYGGIKTMVRDGSFAKQFPEGCGRTSPFDEEYFARDAMAEFWGTQPLTKQASDAYLQWLVNVRNEGLIQEYVWQFLREQDWPQPSGLNLERWEKWLLANRFTENKALTLAFITREGASASRTS